MLTTALVVVAAEAVVAEAVVPPPTVVALQMALSMLLSGLAVALGPSMTVMMDHDLATTVVSGVLAIVVKMVKADQGGVVLKWSVVNMVVVVHHNGVAL